MMPGFAKNQLIGKQAYSALSEAIEHELGINILGPGLVYDVTVNNEQIDVAISWLSAWPMGNKLLRKTRQVSLTEFDPVTALDIQLAQKPHRTADRVSGKAWQLSGLT